MADRLHADTAWHHTIVNMMTIAWHGLFAAVRPRTLMSDAIPATLSASIDCAAFAVTASASHTHSQTVLYCLYRTGCT